MAQIISESEFRQNFDKLCTAIVKEWPQIPEETLRATEGKLDDALALISQHTEHTKTLLTRQLAELSSFVGKTRSRLPSLDSLEDLVDNLEKRSEVLAEQLQGEVLPQVKDKAQENIGASLLTALGLGFILGLLFGGFGRGR